MKEAANDEFLSLTRQTIEVAPTTPAQRTQQTTNYSCSWQLLSLLTYSYKLQPVLDTGQLNLLCNVHLQPKGTFLYPPSEGSETGGDYVFTFVCVCPSVRT